MAALARRLPRRRGARVKRRLRCWCWRGAGAGRWRLMLLAALALLAVAEWVRDALEIDGLVPPAGAAAPASELAPLAALAPHLSSPGSAVLGGRCARGVHAPIVTPSWEAAIAVCVKTPGCGAVSRHVLTGNTLLCEVRDLQQDNTPHAARCADQTTPIPAPTPPPGSRPRGGTGGAHELVARWRAKSAVPRLAHGGDGRVRRPQTPARAHAQRHGHARRLCAHGPPRLCAGAHA